MKLGKLSTTPVKFLLKISILDFFLALGKCLGTKGAPTPTCGLSNRSDYPKVDFFYHFFSPKHSNKRKIPKKKTFFRLILTFLSFQGFYRMPRFRKVSESTPQVTFQIYSFFSQVFSCKKLVLWSDKSNRSLVILGNFGTTTRFQNYRKILLKNLAEQTKKFVICFTKDTRSYTFGTSFLFELCLSR